MAKLFGALFVVLDALLLASFRSFFLDVVFYFLSEPLGVDFELPSKPSGPKNFAFLFGETNLFEKSKIRSKAGSDNVLGLSWADF